MEFSRSSNCKNNEKMFEVEDIDNTNSSLVSKDLTECLTQNCDENINNLPFYEDPFPDDNKRIINSFKNQLRSALNSEIAYLERKEILNNNSELLSTSLSSFYKKDFTNTDNSSKFSKSSETTTRCESLNLCDESFITDYCSEKDLFEDYINDNSELFSSQEKQSKVLLETTFSEMSDKSNQSTSKCDNLRSVLSSSVSSIEKIKDFPLSETSPNFLMALDNITCSTSSDCLNDSIISNLYPDIDLFENNFNLPLKLSNQSDDNNEISSHQSTNLLSEWSGKLNQINKCNDSPHLNNTTSINAHDNSMDTHYIDQLCHVIENENNTVLSDDIYQDHSLKERKTYIIESIQELIKSLIKSYKETGNVTLFIDNTSKWDNLEFTEQMLAIRKECDSRNISIKNEKTQFRFTLINYLLNEILKKLLAGFGSTLRELYYQDPELCQDQIYLTKSLHDICCLLHCTPWELGIYSSSKGLIAGSLLISLGKDIIIDCSSYQTIGFLLPKVTAAIQIIDCNAEFILLVEKDTVFEKLLQQKIFKKIPKQFILITGRGYPDINTRLLLRKILNKYKIPIYALVDADPFGIEIMLIYSFGSKELSYMSHCLACPEIQWIGVLPSEIELLGIPSIPLTNEDKMRIDDLFKRPYINNKIQYELNKLLEFNRKAEIEGISSFSFHFLVNNYIPNKIA